MLFVVLCLGVEWYFARSNQTAALGYVFRSDQIAVCFACISHQSDCRIRVCIPHQSHHNIWISAPITAFWYCFLVNDVMESEGRAQRITLT